MNVTEECRTQDQAFNSWDFGVSDEPFIRFESIEHRLRVYAKERSFELTCADVVLAEFVHSTDTLCEVRGGRVRARYWGDSGYIGFEVTPEEILAPNSVFFYEVVRHDKVVFTEQVAASVQWGCP